MEPKIDMLEKSQKQPAASQACVSADAYFKCVAYGAALVCSEVKDSVCLLHGPQGCTQSVREAYQRQNREYHYCQSTMKHKHVVFGGSDALIATMLEILSPFEYAGPVVIVNTCAPEIIGDDLHGIVDKVNPTLPVVAVSDGFRKDHYWSINETLKVMVEKFAAPYSRPKPSFVNIIGNIGGSRQWRADVYEMSRLLSALGLRVNRLGCDSSLEYFTKSSSAVATILMTPEIGAGAAAYLQSIFDQKVIVSPLGLPLGLRGTEAWLRNVGTELSIKPELIDNLIDIEEDRVRRRLKIGLNDMVYIEKTSQLKNMKAAIVAESICALSWARFVHEELEVEPILLATRTLDDPDQLHPSLYRWLTSKNGYEVMCTPTVEAVQQALTDHRPQLVFGSSIEGRHIENARRQSFIQIAQPNDQFVTINPRPMMGYRGLLHTCESILNQIG